MLNIGEINTVNTFDLNQTKVFLNLLNNLFKIYSNKQKKKSDMEMRGADD